MKKYNSCLNCKKRYIGCHNTCEDYKKYKKELEIIKQNKKLNNFNYSYKRRYFKDE